MMIKQIEPEDVEIVETATDERKPWRFRHARLIASAIFSVSFVCLLWLALYFIPAQALVHPDAPRYRVALGEMIVIVALTVVCAVLSAIAANYVASLFLPRTLKKAAPYHLVMNWIGIADRDKILGLIRLHELHVYVSARQALEETDDLPCRMVPLFLLSAYPPFARWALRLFREIYFDMEELEAVFGNNLDTVRRARPDMLIVEGSLTKETAAKLKMFMDSGGDNKGTDGRLETMQAWNNYYKLQGYVLTKLVRKFDEKWEKRQTKTEKIVTHTSIQILAGEILSKEPGLEAKLLELGVKGSPKLPKAMEDFFRHAMPDEMVDWRNGKPTLEDLIEKYTKGYL